MKFQAKSFPEQLNSALNENREYIDNYSSNKHSKLPVTSR